MLYSSYTDDGRPSSTPFNPENLLICDPINFRFHMMDKAHQPYLSGKFERNRPRGTGVLDLRSSSNSYLWKIGPTISDDVHSHDTDGMSNFGSYSPNAKVPHANLNHLFNTKFWKLHPLKTFPFPVWTTFTWGFWKRSTNIRSMPNLGEIDPEELKLWEYEILPDCLC